MDSEWRELQLHYDTCTSAPKVGWGLLCETLGGSCRGLRMCVIAHTCGGLPWGERPAWGVSGGAGGAPDLAPVTVCEDSALLVWLVHLMAQPRRHLS